LSGSICALFVNATKPALLYTLSLHDALPIWLAKGILQRIENMTCMLQELVALRREADAVGHPFEQLHAQALFQLHDRSSDRRLRDRKSTRLNSSHVKTSYAVFCLKKKKREHT